MYKLYLIIFFIIGANCNCNNKSTDIPTNKPNIGEQTADPRSADEANLNDVITLVKKLQSSVDLLSEQHNKLQTSVDQLSEEHKTFEDSTAKLQSSVDRVSVTVTISKKDVNNCLKQSSSNLKSILDELQKNLTERTEQIIDEKLESISEDHKNSALNMNKLQTSVDQLSEEHKTFGDKLDKIQKNGQILDQKIIALSEDHQNSTAKLQSSVDRLSVTVANKKKDVNNCPNKSSSNLKSILDELQKNLTERTEQIIDEKLGSISEDHKNSALNMNKLQTSVDQLSEEHKTFGDKLDEIQKNGQILDQKIIALSEDHQNSTAKLQCSVDRLSVAVANKKKDVNNCPNKSSSNLKSILDELQKNLTERTEQIIDEKLESISEDHKNSALNMNKLQTSVDQLSEEHKTFGDKLDKIQKNGQILDQKIIALSEDHQNSTAKLQSSVDRLSVTVANKKKDVNNCPNKSSSNLKSILDELQKNLTERTEQIIDEKLGSISEDHKNSALNMNKLQTSVDQLSEEHKTFGDKLDEIQKNGQILDQKIIALSEDHQNSTAKLQSSVDRLSVAVANKKKDVNNCPNKSSSNLKSILDELQKNLTETTEQIIDEKLESISEDHKNSALNMNKLQTSVDQLSEEHKTFGDKLDKIQKNGQILDQKIIALSEDHQNSTAKLQSSVDRLSVTVANKKKDVNNCPNKSSSNLKSILDELQKNLTERTEQIIDEKLGSISEDHKNSALNMNKLQTSVDQLSEEHKTFGDKLDEIQKNGQILDQKILALSEDHQNSTAKLQSSVDRLSVTVANKKKDVNNCPNKSSSNLKSILDELQKNLTERTEQIIDEKLGSISEDHKNSALNMNKLQTSVDQLSEEHNKILSIIKIFEHKLDEINICPNKTEPQNWAEDCLDVYNAGQHFSESYLLQKYSKEVFCDMETDGGGWLVIQKRRKLTKQVNFNRDWLGYKEGFGCLTTEFWIGNEFLHRITNQKSYELRIDMEDFKRGPFYVTYNEFRVGNEKSGYKLHLGGGSIGTVEDGFSFHNEHKFSTFDRDNDGWDKENCAERYSGGFWFGRCYRVYLNGEFPTIPNRSNERLISWHTPTTRLILTKVEMKIRPSK